MDAIDKGASQYFTPLDLAKAVAKPLPDSREYIGDLVGSGRGDLLMGASTFYTKACFGVELDSRFNRKPDDAASSMDWSTIIGDATQVYDLLQQVKLTLPLTVGNPPFGLQWYRDRLAGLKDSAAPAVANYWKHLPPGDTIDSGIASYLISVDRLTNWGEGYIILNKASAERDILANPYLRQNVWMACWLEWFKEVGKKTEIAVLYYSRLINSDNHRILDLRGKDLAGITKELWRKPPVRTTPGYLTPPQLDWANVKDQWNGLKGRRKLPYNLGLSPLGRVQISLTPFDHKGKSVRMNPGAVQQLHQMAGKAPMQLVVQSHTRILLQTAMDSDLWRVDPKLIEAVTAAVKDYESSRAPLIALNQVQSLGYLDEHATILCEKDFEPFEAGQRYRLQTELMECEVEKLITNSSGGQEQVVRRGQELVIKVSRDSHVVHFLYEHEGYFFPELKGKQGCFKLQTLLDHFHIPKVPSLTELRQDDYEENRRRVIAMAAMISANMQKAAV